MISVLYVLFLICVIAVYLRDSGMMAEDSSVSSSSSEQQQAAQTIQPGGEMRSRLNSVKKGFHHKDLDRNINTSNELKILFCSS